MPAQVISMFSRLVEQDIDAFQATKRAMRRPFLLPVEPTEWSTWTDDRKDHEITRWFLESLWLEGFKVVWAGEDDE